MSTQEKIDDLVLMRMIAATRYGCLRIDVERMARNLGLPSETQKLRYMKRIQAKLDKSVESKWLDAVAGQRGTIYRLTDVGRHALDEFEEIQRIMRS